MSLSFEEMKMACYTYWSSFSPLNKKRLEHCFDSCEKLSSEKEKKFFLNQTLNMALWDFPEAVEIGFRKFIEANFKERIEAINYHQANRTEDCKCKICMLFLQKIQLSSPAWC